MASRITSRHHCNIVKTIIINPKIIGVIELPWNQDVRPIVNINAPIEPVNGHGLNSTK